MSLQGLEKFFRYFIVIYLGTYFLIGICIFRDYGLVVDESIQRQHSILAYKYINEKLFGRKIERLSKYNRIKYETYKWRYYGVAMQMPMVIVEDITNFTMTERQIAMMRHFLIYLYHFIGYIFFYLALLQLFRSSEWRYGLSFIGVIFISLYPRFFATQFVDIKNMVFVGLTMTCFYFLVNAVEKKRVTNYILFGIVSALATNQRIMGIVFPATLLGYFFFSDFIVCIKSRTIAIEDKKKYFLVVIPFILFWTLIMPAAWNNPVKGFVGTFEMFSHFRAWDDTMVFMGKLITCDQQPWYYLLLWLGISIPILYIVLFFIAHYDIARGFLCNKAWQEKWNLHKWKICAGTLFWGSVGSVILLKSRIYVGWHHMYFVFVFFVILTVYGCEVLLKRFGEKVYAIVAVMVVLQGVWIVKNHPFEPAYLNIIGRRFGDQFDREEFRSCTYPALQWILDNEKGNITIKGGVYGKRAVAFLPENDRTRVIKEGGTRYIIEDYRNVIGNNPQHIGYEDVYDIWVDGYKVCSVFREVKGNVE